MPFSEALTEALQAGDINQVAHLITEEKAWDEPNEEGFKPIHVAISHGHLDVVAWLLKNGVSFECTNVLNGLTSLHIAAFSGQTKIIEHLINVYQDNPNKKSIDGMTPLLAAAAYGHIETVAFLLKHGADIHQADNDGASPLFVAAQGDYIQIVALLLEHGANHQTNNNGESPLFIAAQEGHTEIVALLLEHGAEICQATKNGISPLCIAAFNGHKETVTFLLDHHADIRQADNDGASPLYVAAGMGHTATVALLLDRHADIRQANNNGVSPLYIAAQEGHTATVALLLDYHADLQQTDKDDTSPLFIAAQEGHTAIVALLLDHHADIHQTDKDGKSPLYIAACNGRTETVALLLHRHADVHQARNNGASPLWIAAKEGYTETVALLLDNHADIQQANNDGESPLYVAAGMGHTTTVSLLLERHADIAQATNNGVSPLFIAVQKGYTSIVVLLLDHHANICQATHNGASPLWIAAQEGYTAIAALLLDRGADIHQAKKDGASPLFIAAQKGHLETAALLLDRGADIRQANNDGVSPLWIAAEIGHTAMVTFLLDRHADIQQTRKDGTSPLFIAAQNGHTETVALLLDRHAVINQTCNDGASPLLVAAERGHTTTVTLLLARGADIQQENNDGVSPLCIAAQEGQTATVALLLDHHANILEPKNDGASPLYIAARNGHPETVALLLRRGAQREQATFNQRTPLWTAAFSGHAEVVEILLTNHAMMTPDNKGDTPLHIAVKQGHIAVAKLLLLHNAAVTTLNAEKQTPLMLAAIAQDPAMFAWLLAVWFQQQLLMNPETEDKQEIKKIETVSLSQDNYNYADDSYKIVSVIAEQVLSQDISHWPHLSPTALTLAKATRQSLSLEISQEQSKLAIKLGEGAFGEVFRAVLPFGTVALKRMKLDKIADWFKVSLEEANDILQWEISQLEKVRHPHVVELLSVAHSETPLLAMELCDTTLDKALPKTPYTQWQIAWEVACGLAYLHSLSLVHRDIKPENILLKEGIAKIADMGLAQIDPLLLDKTEPVQLQSLIGDTQWASPEEKLAFKAYHQGKGSLEDIKTVSTAAADIYRYGLVVNTFYQPMWRAIIEACLQLDPQARPSALQVLGALESNIPHPYPVLAKLCQRLGIFAHYHQNELAHFLIPWVSPKPEIDWLTYQEGVEVTGDDAPQPFTTLWQDFLFNSENRLLDLRGAGGLGKTLLGYYQLKKQWQALRQWLIKPEGNPPTLVLLLTPDYLPTSAFTLEERLAEVYQLTPDECQILKQYPVVFLLDGEDEWQARPQLDLSHWPNAKAWIIGRPSVRTKDSVYLLPFNQVQIVNYLRHSLTWDTVTTQDFITQLPHSAIKEVLRNPFVLSMFRILWPIPNWQGLTKESIYYTYFTQFIEKQQRHWLTGPYHKIYIELISHLQQQHPTLAESYLRFVGEVSLQLFEARRLEGTVDLNSPWNMMPEKVQSLAEDAFKEKQQLLLASHEKTHLTLQQYQTFALAHLQRFVMPAPLELGHYRFRHKSLFEYAWAYTAPLPNRPLEEDEALLTTYALLHQKENEEKLDFSLIEASKKDPTLSCKAGNLLTLYNWARLPLIYDYQGAHITNANLAYANLIDVDFRGAILTNCYFAYACIERAHFDQIPDRTLTGKRAQPFLLAHRHPILCSALSPSGKLLATVDREQVFIWHHQKRISHFKTRIEAPTALAIDDTGALLIGDNKGYLYFYSGDTRQRKLHAHFESILGVEFINEELCWAGSAYDNIFYHRKHYTRERQWPNQASITCSVFHSLSWQHALGTQDGSVTMNSIKEILVKDIWSYAIHQGANTALSFSLTGNLATGGMDGKIQIFKQNTKSPCQTLHAIHPIKSLHWSQDSQVLVTVTSQDFKLWDVTGRKLGNFKTTAIQAIYMKNSYEGILVEKGGSLYGIALKNGEINITWVVAGEHFKGGINIESINEASDTEQAIKEQEEVKIEQQPAHNNQILLTPVLEQQGLFSARNQNTQEQGVNATHDLSQKTRSSICTLL